MASRERAIVEALATLLRGIAGTGGYVFDFSGTDKVVIGAPPTENALVPRVFLSPRGTSVEPGGALNLRQRSFEVEIWGFASPTSQTGSERCLIALDLAAELRTKIETELASPSLRLGGLVYDFGVQTEGVDGARSGFGDVGCAHLVVTCLWDATIGSAL